jgi:hypothetical protein
MSTKINGNINSKWLKYLFAVSGAVALLWFLLRVIPKPSRASYPCMRAAAPFASSFVIWIVGIGASAVAMRNSHKYCRKSKATVLYLIDGLYGGYYWEGRSFRWHMPPFNGDWPSSLFISQDPVAIDSVAYDFLLTEWPHVVENGTGSVGSLQGGAQDYLHEAALADNPPSKAFFDPENDGVVMNSLGVHEHWNNSTDKQYSRNLGAGDGIELISNTLDLPACNGDFDEDNDIDANDLVELILDTNQLDLGVFAFNFGTLDCYN